MPAVFVVGAPRSGTHFVAELFRGTKGYVSRHCDDLGSALGDSFFGYAKWYGLSLNAEPLLRLRRRVQGECRPAEHYVESNCYLSLFTPELDGAFQPHFILLRRRPVDVVNSLFVKGWYQDPVFAPPSYDYDVARPNHAFGRLLPPTAAEFERWKRLTRIGRIAWFYNALNTRLVHDLRGIERRCWTVLHLDRVSHASFSALQRQLGSKQSVSEGDFQTVVARRPGRAGEHRSSDDWSAKELAEFRAECRDVGEVLGEPPG